MYPEHKAFCIAIASSARCKKVDTAEQHKVQVLQEAFQNQGSCFWKASQSQFV